MVITLSQKPRLHESYYILNTRESQEIVLYSEGRVFCLQPVDPPDLLEHLLPLLNGEHSVKEIVEILGNFDEAKIIDSLESLFYARLLEDSSSQFNLLSEAQQQFHSEQLTFLSHFVVEPAVTQAVLTQSQIAVFGLGTLGQQLLTSLANNGIGQLVGIDVEGYLTDKEEDFHNQLRYRYAAQNPEVNYRGISLKTSHPQQIAESVEGAQLLIAALDNPDPNLLDNVNEACIQTGIPWMPVGIRGREGYLGPTVIPHQTACYKCYDLRMKANLTHYEQYLLYEQHLKTNPDRRSYGSLPQYWRLIADTAAIEVIKVLTHFYPPVTYGRILTFDFLTLTTNFHEVLKLPRCPACGEPSQRMPMMNPWAE